MEDNPESDEGPIHPNNGQLELFMNPLPKITQKPKGFIGFLRTSHYMKYYFPNMHECKIDQQ